MPGGNTRHRALRRKAANVALPEPLLTEARELRGQPVPGLRAYRASVSCRSPGAGMAAGQSRRNRCRERVLRAARVAAFRIPAVLLSRRDAFEPNGPSTHALFGLRQSFVNLIYCRNQACSFIVSCNWEFFGACFPSLLADGLPMGASDREMCVLPPGTAHWSTSCPNSVVICWTGAGRSYFRRMLLLRIWRPHYSTPSKFSAPTYPHRHRSRCTHSKSGPAQTSCSVRNWGH
jgi:hypothetical protein